MTIAQPSTFLPPLSRKNDNIKIAELADALDQLRTALASTGLDSYERSYSQTWLTSLFTKCEDHDILEEAGELLTKCTSLLQPETNRSAPYSFSTQYGLEEITIEESYMQDVHATGFRTWSSAVHLAGRMLADPSKFFQSHNFSPTKALQVLELGSGTGLAGIAAVKALSQLPGDARVVLSDMDPSTLVTLRQNVLNNHISLNNKGKLQTDIIRLDWNDISDCVLDPFHVIIGADIVYEPEHADLLYEVVHRLLAKQPESLFHLVLVARPTHEEDIRALDKKFSGQLLIKDEACLVITRCEEVEAAEDELYPYTHKYYEIRWRALPNT